MTLAYYCVLAAFLLPYMFTVLAKIGHPGFDNHNPREFLSTLTGWRQRANHVQQNSFEIFPAFAAAVIIAHLTHKDPMVVDALAVTFVGTRILYGVCYVADQATMRTILWFMGAGIVVSLFF